MSSSWWRRWLKRNPLPFPLVGRPRQRRRTASPRLWLEALEDRTLLSAFYDLSALASTASGGFTGFGNLISVNSLGEAAFVGSTAQGQGLYVLRAGDQSPTNINPTFSTTPGRTFGRGAAINDAGQVAAVDLCSADGYYGYTLRRWDSNALNSSVILSQAGSNPDIVPQGNDKDYQALVTSLTDINDSGAVVFDSIGGLAVQPPTTIDIGGLPITFDGGFASSSPPYLDVQYAPGTDVTAGAYTTIDQNLKTGAGYPSPHPQMTVLGQTVYYSATDRAIELTDQYGGKTIIASGWKSLGYEPGVSSDGNVVVFTGDEGKGPGVFAAYKTGGKYQIVRIAGEGMDNFVAFDPTSAVQVGGGSIGGVERGVTVAFVGSDPAVGYGLYTARLSFFGKTPDTYDPQNVASVRVSGIEPVALLNDVLPDGKTIDQIQFWHGIDQVDRGRLTFWVQTTDNTQEIIQADPTQIVWVDFNPPDSLPAGTTGANLSLFQQVNLTNLGWDGSMASALSSAKVSYDAATIQNAVVNEVQAMYQATGARVTVLGRTTDQMPEYVPELIGGTNQLAGVFQTVYVGEGPPVSAGGSGDLGLASQPPAAAGVLDFYYQVTDSTAVVFVNNILTDGAYPEGSTPATLSQAEIVNGIATIIAHEAGHNFGLFHLARADLTTGIPYTNLIMIEGTNTGEFEAPPAFSNTVYPVTPYTSALDNVTESDAARLDYSTDSAGGAPPDKALLQLGSNGTIRANVGFQAANPISVQHLFIGLQSNLVETMPTFVDLGSGDLATLLNNANIPADPLDQMIVLGSTDGSTIDIVGVASGQEGAQNSLNMSVLGLTTDPRLQASVSGTGAAFHFYQLTSTGAVDLGTAAIETTSVNHPPVLASIGNQVTTPGSTVTFTAVGTDPDQGQTLTYSLDPGAPVGASIDPTSGVFTWTPATAQAGQLYNITVRVTDNGTPPASATAGLVINVENKLQTVAVTMITSPTPGPMQIAVDFNETLQPTPAQAVGNYRIVSAGGISLPIQSAVYSDNGTQHRVVLTVAAGTQVVPDVYHVSINAPNLTAANGDVGAPKGDQLWVDVTSTNTLEPITVQPDGSFGVAGSGEFLGYGAPLYVVAGNFTGSGRTDLVVATSGEVPNTVGYVYDPLLLLKSNGDGTYAAPVPIALGGPYQVEGLYSVDWNHDGSPDLVVSVLTGVAGSGSEKYYYYVLLNDGHGNFTNAPETPIPESPNYQPGAFGVYDLNGNGQYEIIRAGAFDNNGNTTDLEVISKDPNLGYTVQMHLPVSMEGNPGEFSFADLNGDGKPDIIIGNATALLSTPTGYTTGTDLLGLGGQGIGAFTGPGQKDIAGIYDDYSNSADVHVGDVIQVAQNDGKGNFTAQTPIILNRRDVAAHAFGDVNGDGIPDVVMILTPGTGQYGTNPYVYDHVSQLSVWTWTADGHGGFHPTTPAPIPLATTDQSAPFSITLADLDADGHLDVILSNYESGGEIRVAINDGTGTMRPPTAPLPYVGNFGSGQQQVFADLTNDGRTDFITTSPGGADVYLAQNDGTFKHMASLPDPFGSDYDNWIRVGDLNNDGIPDIVVGGIGPDPASGGGMLVYLGNGDGTFRRGPEIQAPAPYASIVGLTLVDINNDGNLDAVATLRDPFVGGSGEAFAVFFGDGKGDLTFNANTLVPAYFAGNFLNQDPSPVLGDFNGDGKLDLIVPTQNSSTGVISLTDYFGVGNGTFTPGPIIGNNDYVKILVGDLNGDGKADLVVLHSDFTATVYLGNGHGGFTKGTTLNLSTGTDQNGSPIGPGDLVLGDFTGDGRLDLAVSNSNSHVVDIYEGDGSGNFGPPQSITVRDSPGSLSSIPRAPFLDAGTFAVTDHGPVANNDTASVFAGSLVSIPVLANDTDQDNVPLTIIQVTIPAHGAAHVDPTDNNIIYASAAGFVGTDTFNYTIVDPAGVASTATVTVSVAAILITPATLPGGQVGTSYSQQLSASGGTGPYTFAVASGILPAGVSLSTGGMLSGTPTAGGSFTFTIQAKDSGTRTGSQQYTLTLNAATITVSPASLPAATVGAAFNQSVAASGGTAAYTFAIASGNLPAGVSLSTGGKLSGTPTAGGSFTFTIAATDSSTGSGPYTGSQQVTLTVGPATIALIPTSLPAATVGASYNQTLSATGGTSPYSFAIASGSSLPAGLSLSSSGTLSGTPTADGNFTVTIEATDSSSGTGPYSGSQKYTLIIYPPVFSYNSSTQTLTISANAAANNFTFSQATTEDTSNTLRTSYNFTVNGVSQTYTNNQVVRVLVNALATTTNTAILITNGTYVDNNGVTQGTHETISLGSKTDAGVGTILKYDPSGKPFTFLTLSGFPISYAYAGRNDGTVQLYGTAGIAYNGFVSAGNYSYIGGPGLYHEAQGATSVYGYSAGQATDFAYHYSANAGSAYVVSGTAFSYMSSTDQNPDAAHATQSFFNVGVGFGLNTGVSNNPGKDFAYIIDSPGNDTFVGGDAYSYMYSSAANGSYTEFDTAYAFAVVYGESFVGGTDTATNSDPSKNILVGFHIQ